MATQAVDLKISTKQFMKFDAKMKDALRGQISETRQMQSLFSGAVGMAFDMVWMEEMSRIYRISSKGPATAPADM